MDFQRKLGNKPMDLKIKERFSLGLVCLLIVIFFSGLLLPREGVDTSGNSGKILNKALLMYSGELPPKLNRGPVFPLVIALSYKLFGISVFSAFFVTRFFYSLCGIIIFLLGRRLFDPWVGMTASLLYLFSYGINDISSMIDTDTTVPCLIIFSIYLCFRAFQEQKRTYSIASGLVLGIAFLTKEIALIMVPLPVFYALFVPQFRRKRYLVILSGLLISFVVTILPWVILVYLKSGNPLQILGFIRPEALAQLNRGGTYSGFILKYFSNPFAFLMNFFEAYIKPKFALYPLFLASWAWIVVHYFRRWKREDLVLLLSGLLFLPIIVALGKHYSRLGQAGVFYCITYLVVARFVMYWIDYLKKRSVHTQSEEYPWHLVKIACVTALLMIQIFFPGKDSYDYLFKGNTWANSFWLSKEFGIGGRHNRFIQEASEWIKAHAKMDDVVLIGKSDYNAVEFFTSMKYETHPLDLYHRVGYLRDEVEKGSYNRGDKILFIFPHQRFASDSVRHQIVYLFFEKDLLNSLTRVRANYLVVSLKEGILTLYLDKALWAERAFRNDHAAIYRINVKEVMPLADFGYITSSRFKRRLSVFKAKYPDKYQTFADILSYFDLTDEDLVENSYENYQKKWVRENIPSGSRIAFSHSSDRCEIAGEGYHKRNFNRDTGLAQLKEAYDYLFIHNSRVRNNEFPTLFKELEQIKPIGEFPKFFYFGDGWEIYKL
jgi:hypothetical protein